MTLCLNIRKSKRQVWNMECQYEHDYIRDQMAVLIFLSHVLEFITLSSPS